MNSYNSSLTNTYSDRQTLPLSRSEHTAINKENRPVSESVREGQQLRGEIINRTTTDVTIRLSNGQTLQARLDVSVPLSIGQTASFEVTHADPALISLRILQNESSFAQNALIQKALTAAELPVTSRNAELVNTLLQHNLPISKESILSLIRQSNTYPNTDINTLALLTQHKLPVTQATLTQFEAYQNYEHQILPQLKNLAHSLSELAVSADSVPSESTQLLQNLLHQIIYSAPDAVSPAGAAINPESPNGNANPEVPAGTAVQPESQSSNTTPEAPANTAVNPESPNGNANPEAPAGSAVQPESPNGNVNPETPVGSAVNPESLNSSTTPNAPANAASVQDKFVQQLLSRWTLSPAELTDQDRVKEFYQQLRKDLAELHSALVSEATLRSARNKETPDSPLERLVSDTASATAQLQDNLEFMNMLNRIFPYVQLPIRFSDKTAHGELYVYTKKEKLRHETGNISVLLHLDMESLGPTDIYLSLTGNSLNSRFYLNAPELETLFTDHLPELKEALANKGFDTSFELVSRKQENDPVREFLNNHDVSGLSRFTFDCRA